MDNILFIVPPCIRFDDFINPVYNTKVKNKYDGVYGDIVTDMPLGTLALSAYLKKHTSVKTKLVDFNLILNQMSTFTEKSFGDFFNGYLSQQEYVDYHPTVIAISALFTPSYHNMIEIGRITCQLFPDALILAGGGVPQNMALQVYKDSKCFDALCYGEGEIPLRELLDVVGMDQRKNFLQKHSSWITPKKLEKHQAFYHKFIENLDEIPFYDYDLCNIKDYSINPAFTAYAAVNQIEANFHIMTSRGCPQKCIFCASHTVHGRKMRYYSVERVREDFFRLRDQYGAKTLVFQDDHLMGDVKRALKIIKIVGELGITAVFQNGLALFGLTREMLEAIKAAGVEQLTLPVESGSQRVLRKIMKKPLNLKIVSHVLADCRDLGIYTNVNILIGMPGETKKDIDDAIVFLQSINANWFAILFATPLAGSEMLDICLEKGYIRGDYTDTDYKKAIVETEDFTVEYIFNAAYSMNLELNFVRNADYRLGEYKKALIGFENSIKAKNDHAFGHYFTGKCYAKLGNQMKSKEHLDIARKIFSVQPFWRKYATKFSIPKF